MIFVKRDLSAVDKELLKRAKEASDALAAIVDPKERMEFIKANSRVWSAFRSALGAMSFGKCWYSEAAEVVSRYDVDHFRPKGQARISRTTTSDGYSWLAFDPSNYVLAGQLCNQSNREYSDAAVGKANWFPLQDPEKAATLKKPSHSSELPVLLDPTDPDAPTVLEFGEDGSVSARSDLDADFREMIEWSIELLGIRQTALNGARAERWRVVHFQARQFKRIAAVAPVDRTEREAAAMKELAAELRGMASCKSPFAAMTRDALRAQQLDRLIRQEELEGLEPAA